MEKEKIIIAFLLTALLLSTIGVSAGALVRTPGVNVGDTFTYGNISFEWNCSNPAVVPPAEWVEMNQTEWILGTVESVVGTNVTATLLFHFKNGTETSESGWIDVDTGDNLNLDLFFISANLNISDPIYSSGSHSTWYISDASLKAYPGDGQRMTNHNNITGATTSQNLYWDKATGALTEMSMTYNQTTTYTLQYSLSLELIESNVWVVPEFAGLPKLCFCSPRLR